jgi:16S rRNA (uracil1498-N3)-methyltransferase
MMQHYFATSIQSGIIRFNEEDEHHIRHVMRLTINDEIIGIFQGVHYQCKIMKMDKNNIEIAVIEPLAINNELSKPITLIYSKPKMDRFEIVLQKATELGVYRIIPLISQYSQVKIDNLAHKYLRWQRIMKEAAEQSRRNIIPELLLPIHNKEVALYLGSVNILANETLAGYSTPLLQQWVVDKSNKDITLLVGCEGGFSDDEFVYYEQLGFNSISLGKRILRSETAALSLLAIVAFYLEGR